MRDMEELIPTERDEEIYAAWESGKTPRVCAREFGVSRTEAERAIDRCLPVFNSKTEMMAYKRERQKLDDIGSKYHAQAMAGDIDSGHLYARINERRCAMAGWTSVNVRLDPYNAQTEEQPTQYEQIKAAILRVANSAPPAQREAVNLISKIGPERALALLKAGNGAGEIEGNGTESNRGQREFRAAGADALNPSFPRGMLCCELCPFHRCFCAVLPKSDSA